MQAALYRGINHIDGVHPQTPASTSTSTMMANLALVPSPTPPTPPAPRQALRPPRPTVSLDPTPVLIPMLSSVVSFPVIALALICALRYRALRLRRKEHLRRIRGGGLRAARLEVPGAGERPSFFSRDSSSGDTSSRQPNNIEEDHRTTGAAPSSSSSSSSGDDDFTSGLAEACVAGGSRRSSRVRFGAAAAILHLPPGVLPSPRSTSPARSSPSPRSASPRSGSVSFFAEPSFIPDLVNDYGDDADEEDNLESVASDCTDRAGRRKDSARS